MSGQFALITTACGYRAICPTGLLQRRTLVLLLLHGARVALLDLAGCPPVLQ